jgi:hypothetical protein
LPLALGDCDTAGTASSERGKIAGFLHLGSLLPILQFRTVFPADYEGGAFVA